MRSRYDVSPLTNRSGQAGGVPGDDPNRGIAIEQALQDLVADEAGGCGDNDHVLSQCRLPTDAKDRSGRQ